MFFLGVAESAMILLNFSHPLTPEQTARVESLAGQKVDQVVTLTVQFDNSQPFLPQLKSLLMQVPLTAEQWQTEAILIVPPALHVITAMLLADLHGRMGYFPAMLRLRPVADATPTRYEAAEILNLQMVREEARQER
jgi:hypothetical protein